jgi:hypothetical protein
LSLVDQLFGHALSLARVDAVDKPASDVLLRGDGLREFGGDLRLEKLGRDGGRVVVELVEALPASAAATANKNTFFMSPPGPAGFKPGSASPRIMTGQS